METLLAQILANLPGLMASAQNIVSYINQVRAAAQQSGQWTDEQELEFQGLLAQAKVAPAWQPDPPPTGPQLALN